MEKNELIEFLNNLISMLTKRKKEAEQKSIDEISPYSNSINTSIRSGDELSVYTELGLKEMETTRKAVIFDINPFYITPSGKTNLERMLAGYPPYDEETNSVIQIHHIGQNYDSPFAELPKKIHLGAKYYSKLHDIKIYSWRLNPGRINATNKEISEHWKMRGAEIASRLNEQA